MDRRPCEHCRPGYYGASAGLPAADFGLLVGCCGCCIPHVVAAAEAAGYYSPGVDFGSEKATKLKSPNDISKFPTHSESALIFLQLVASRVSSLALLLLIIVSLIISLITFLVGASGLIFTILDSHVRCRRLARILRRSRARV